MRSRRQGESQISSEKVVPASTISAENSLPLTPPRNSRPMATAAITTNAPMSGSSSSSRPTRATAAPIGAKPLRTLCMWSCLRTV